MNYITTTALGLLSACTLYFIKREEDQAEMAIRQNFMDIFDVTVVPHCTNLSTLSALGSVCKKFNDCCKEPIRLQKSKFDDLVLQIRSLVPVLNLEEGKSEFPNSYDDQKINHSTIHPVLNLEEGKSEFPNSYDDQKTFQITIPAENKLVSISLKIENIKTLFVFTYNDHIWKEDGYSPWSLKVIASDPMDEQTSTLVKLALNQLNKELKVKAKESINNGFAIWHMTYEGYTHSYGGLNSYCKATPSNYKHYSKDDFKNFMEEDGYFGNLI